jgi:hypothetical protein
MLFSMKFFLLEMSRNSEDIFSSNPSTAHNGTGTVSTPINGRKQNYCNF